MKKPIDTTTLKSKLMKKPAAKAKAKPKTQQKASSPKSQPAPKAKAKQLPAPLKPSSDGSPKAVEPEQKPVLKKPPEPKQSQMAEPSSFPEWDEAKAFAMAIDDAAKGGDGIVQVGMPENEDTAEGEAISADEIKSKAELDAEAEGLNQLRYGVFFTAFSVLLAAPNMARKLRKKPELKSLSVARYEGEMKQMAMAASNQLCDMCMKMPWFEKLMGPIALFMEKYGALFIFGSMLTGAVMEELAAHADAAEEAKKNQPTTKTEIKEEGKAA